MPRPDASQKLSQVKGPKQGPPTALIAAILAAVLVIGGCIAFFATRSNDDTKDVAMPKSAQSSGNGVIAYPGAAKSGAPTVDVYEDFQCPICNSMEKSNGSQIWQDAKTGKIKLIVHMMSFLDDRFNNTGSKIAANASFCAADQGKFPEYHKANFAGQPAQEGAGYTKDQLKQFGKSAGIPDLTKFNKCVDDDTYMGYVKATETRSGKNGVNGTPTVVINGKTIDQDSDDYTKLVQVPGSWESILQAHS